MKSNKRGEIALVIAIAALIAFAYSAGVINWAYHCEPGGLEPKGCRQEQKAK